MLGHGVQEREPQEKWTFFENKPPFTGLLQLIPTQEMLEKIIKTSHVLDRAYFSWLKVRKDGIPLSNSSSKKVTFETGFEGYSVGRVSSKDELLSDIISDGKRLWNGIRLLHKHSQLSKNGLEKAVRGEPCRIEYLDEWMTIFGAELARKRAQILSNQQALAFRMQIKKLVENLPLITYSLNPQGIGMQTYYLPCDPVQTTVSVDALQNLNLNDEEALAFLTMKNIGKFGHPLLRQTIPLIKR